MKNIVIRTLSGAVYVALIVASILLLDNSPIAFIIVFSLFTMIGIKEIYDMSRNEATESWLIILIDMLGGIGLFLSFYLNTKEVTPSSTYFLLVATYLLVRCIIQLYRPRQNAVHSLERSFFALFYVALPMGLLNNIVAVSAPRILLGVFVFIWVNDTGAFLAGITFGKHRLFERISPKKSWEGFAGGVIACILAAIATDKWFNEFFQVPELATWIGLAVVVSIAATFGDLTESLIKRTEGVKDSGNIIPGHGGILDRIDSLLLVSPAVLIYLSLIIHH